MSRYKPVGPRDDASLEEGDDDFLGFRSRVQPGALPRGVAAYIANGRCDRGTFRARKGAMALSTDLNLTAAPVVLDFTLPTAKAISTITRVTTTATVTTTAAHGLATGDTVAIEGATGGDAAYYNGDFLITVTGASTFTYSMTGTPGASAAGTLKAYKGARIFNNYDDLVRGSCVYATAQNIEGVVLAATTSAFVYRDGEAITQIAYPSGETVQGTDDCELVQFLDKVYLFRGAQTADPFTVTIARSGATATATKIAHGLLANDWVTIEGATQAEYNGIFQIAVPTADTFTFTVTGSPVSPAAGTITARPCKPILSWDCDLSNDFVTVPTGYHPTGGTIIRMPAAGWGLEFTRRVIMPLSRTEHILSDFGDAASFDKQYAQLRIRPGGVDWLVGVQPFQELRYLVLYRKSVHQVQVSNTVAQPTAVKEVTRAFGCVARKTIENCGDAILWLSDMGVTGVRIVSELNVIPLTLVLSDTIDDLVQSINWSYAGKAVAKFWDNRYYLAVPTNGSTRNNTVFVFNFLNRSADAPLGEWESVDTYRGDFDIQNFHILDYEGQKRLHAGTSFGFLFLLEEREEDEWGTSAGSINSYPVLGELALRDFQLGTRERKRFTRIRVGSNCTAGDAFLVNFVAKNPDSDLTVHSYTAATTTDASAAIRVPRIKGQAGTVEITTTAGRPEIRSVALEGLTTDRPSKVRT